jgi:hypothetical protein
MKKDPPKMKKDSTRNKKDGTRNKKDGTRNTRVLSFFICMASGNKPQPPSRPFRKVAVIVVYGKTTQKNFALLSLN